MDFKTHLENLLEEIHNKPQKHNEYNKEILETALFEARGRKAIELNLKDINTTIKGKNGSVVLKDILQQLDSLNPSNHTFKAKDLNKIIDNYGLPVKFRNELEKEGWIQATTVKGTLKLTNKAIESLVEAKFGIDKNTKLKKPQKSATKQMDLKVKRYKVPPSPKSSMTTKVIESILSNMIGHLRGRIKSGILLAGNPGTGKTSTIRFIANLFGMNLVTIEAPHITEENLIAIPYIIFDTKTGKEIVKSMQIDASTSEYKLVYAESNLVTQLKKLKVIKEEFWEKIIKKNPLLQKYFNEYFPIIRKVRRNSEADKVGFSTILFLDEYYRRPSQQVGNILRSILDGRIGSDKLPNDVYVIYASNMSDETGDVEQQMEHEEFIQVDFDDVTKEEFAQFIANKFTPVDVNTGEEITEKEVEYQIDPDVYNEFIQILPEKLGQEPEKGLRMSPRRLEQTLLFIDSSLKNIKTVDDVRASLQFLKNLYTDYLTGETNSDYEKAKKLLIKLAKEKGVEVKDDIPEAQPSEWIKTFDLILKIKEQTGDNFKISPIFASPPGQGKTSIIKNQYAEKNQMGMIYINGHELTSDDVIGIPIPEEKGKTVTTKFTEPPLYNRIMKEYNDIKQNHPEYFKEGRKYNVILFIDEFSRVENTKVFNALRMMLLEHRITAEYPLPDDVLIVGAMNPQGQGVSPLSEHMKDVVNVVSCGIAFDDFIKYLETNTEPLYEETFPVASVLRNIISQLAIQMSSDVDSDGNPINPAMQLYYWEINDNVVVYVSPRILSDAYFQTLYQLEVDAKLNMLIDLTNPVFENEEDVEKVVQQVIEIWKNTFTTALKNQIKDKNNLEDYDWEIGKGKIIDIFNENIDTLMEKIATITSQTITEFSLMNIINTKGNEAILTFVDDDILKNSYSEYLKNTDSIEQIITDFNDAFNETFSAGILDFDTKEGILKILTVFTNILSIAKENVSQGDLKLFAFKMKELFKNLSNIENISLDKKNMKKILLYGEIYSSKEFQEFLKFFQ